MKFHVRASRRNLSYLTHSVRHGKNAINELEKLIVRGGDVQNHAANQLSFSFKLLAKCQTIADERNCHKTIPGDNDNFR